MVGIDINEQFLETVRARYGTVPGIELHRCDLGQPGLSIVPVALVHAALIFEHAGLGRPLANALSLVAPGGRLSVVLQLPSASEQAVAPTAYASMQKLKEDFALIEVRVLQRVVAEQGFELLEEERRPVPAGKALWLGIFGKRE